MDLKKIKQRIVSKIDRRSPVFQDNHKELLRKLDEINDLLDLAEIGGGPHHQERLAKRGKMSIRDRIFNVLDPDTPFLEISPLAAYDSEYTTGGGAVAGIGIISFSPRILASLIVGWAP